MAVIYGGNKIGAVKYGIVDIAKIMYGTDLVWKLGGASMFSSGFEGWVETENTFYYDREYITLEGHSAYTAKFDISDNIMKPLSGTSIAALGVKIPELAGRDYDLRVVFRHFPFRDGETLCIHAQGEDSPPYSLGEHGVGLYINYKSGRYSDTMTASISKSTSPLITQTGKTDLYSARTYNQSSGEYEYIQQRRGTTGYFKLVMGSSVKSVKLEQTVENIPFDDTGTTLVFNFAGSVASWIRSYELTIL